MNSEHDPLGLHPRGWRVELEQNQHLRHARRRDQPALTWLLHRAERAYDAAGHESLRDLLGSGSSFVWVSEGRIKAALLVSFYRRPVAMVRYLLVREQADVPAFFGDILPKVERRLTNLGAEWLGYRRCPDWLSLGLSKQGYVVKDRVLGYRRALDGQPTPTGGIWTIRAMTLGDVPQVLGVDHAAFEPFWRLNKLNIQRAVRSCRYPYVLTIKDRVLGYVIADRTDMHGYVSRIAVRPMHQSKGLGRALMDHTLSAMWRDGLDTVELHTQETNLRSRALYRGLGFCLLGRADVYWVKPLL